MEQVENFTLDYIKVKISYTWLISEEKGLKGNLINNQD